LKVGEHFRRSSLRQQDNIKLTVVGWEGVGWISAAQGGDI